MSNPTVLKLTAHQDAPLRREQQRLATYGRSVLSDRDLLALLVDTGVLPGCDPHALVARLLARFGSLSAIGRAHPAELASVPGLGVAGAARLAAAFELALRAGAEEPPATVTMPEDAVLAARPLLLGQTREQLVAVICSKGNRVIGCEVLSQGSANRALLSAREVMVAVLRRDGQKLALAHNHPSGDPTPSPEDIDATARIQRAAKATGLRFLWHVVITETAWRMVPDAEVGGIGRPGS